MIENTSPIILGIDPGTRITGYGVIQVKHSGLTPLDFGCIRPPVTLATSLRYFTIFEAIEELIIRFKPNAVAVETQFLYKNAQSALKLGMARGAVLIAAAKHGVSIAEYAPKKAKLAVVGRGSASKEQVQRMIQCLLNLPCMPEPEDAADALALALCHAHQLKVDSCLNTSKGL